MIGYDQNPFLEMLVSIYGYNEDIQLVKKVIDERGVDENFYLDDLVWFKGTKRLYDILDYNHKNMSFYY